MDDLPPPLPVSRREPLLRGPLILTAISRVLMIPFSLLGACAASNDAYKLLPRAGRYVPRYLAGKIMLAVGLWIFVLLSVLLAWFFFSRRRVFRPLMIYFCCLFLLLIGCIGVHTSHFPAPRSPAPFNFRKEWGAVGIAAYVLSGFLWPFYYAFSPRMKRTFTR